MFRNMKDDIDIEKPETIEEEVISNINEFTKDNDSKANTRTYIDFSAVSFCCGDVS